MTETASAKNMLITGGSRGIGRATAIMAAARGWSVAINYQSNEAAARETAQAAEAAGAKAMIVQGDVSLEADVIRMFDEAEAALGPLDAVVANAGIVAPGAPLADMTLERMRRVIDANVIGALLTAREAARRLPRPMTEPSAALVLMSSAAARLGAPNEYVDYAASKGAVDTMTLGLSKELAASNIRVNGIRPGLIETEIHASGGKPNRAAELGAATPLGRPGTAEEVAEAVMWLCEPGSSYATGATLDIAGGR